MWTCTYRPENVRVLHSRHQVRTLGDARGRLQFIARQHPYLRNSFSWWTPTLSRVHLWSVCPWKDICTSCFQHHYWQQPNLKQRVSPRMDDGEAKRGPSIQWILKKAGDLTPATIMLRETNQSQQDKHRMIPPEWGPQRSQTLETGRRWRVPGLREGELAFHGDRVSVLQHKELRQAERAARYVTVWMYLVPLHRALKNGEDGKLYIMHILPQ